MRGEERSPRRRGKNFKEEKCYKRSTFKSVSLGKSQGRRPGGKFEKNLDGSEKILLKGGGIRNQSPFTKLLVPKNRGKRKTQGKGQS